MKKLAKFATVVMLLLAICISVSTDVNAKGKRIFFPREYRKEIAKNEYYIPSVDKYNMENGGYKGIYPTKLLKQERHITASPVFLLLLLLL